MICSTCGREIVDESKFCTYCGAHVELAPAQEPTTPAEPAPAQEPTIPVESVPAQEPTAPAEFAGTPDTSSTVDSSVQPQGGIFSPPAADPYT
ncbi:MAG: zinc-ribbon domain-containing protein, partial [Coriobacteriales bacterium]|nr:zinc-ribbon domain-containing protein [Coriobacteriales bacterium]